MFVVYIGIYMQKSLDRPISKVTLMNLLVLVGGREGTLGCHH